MKTANNSLLFCAVCHYIRYSRDDCIYHNSRRFRAYARSRVHYNNTVYSTSIFIEGKSLSPRFPRNPRTLKKNHRCKSISRNRTSSIEKHAVYGLWRNRRAADDGTAITRNNDRPIFGRIIT